MKNYVRFINDKSESQWAVIIPDGRMVSLYDENNKFSLKFDTKFNLETGEIVTQDTPYSDNIVSLNYLAGWREDQKHSNYNKLEEVHCYDEYEICLGEINKLSKYKIGEVVSEFKEHGFDVDKDDVWNLFKSYINGFKTGIRNDERGYHLFCPTFFNPFSIQLSTLHPLCTDWQRTYQC